MSHRKPIHPHLPLLFLNNLSAAEKKQLRKLSHCPQIRSSDSEYEREGATIWYIEQLVTNRAARFTIGYAMSPIYDETNLEHRARKFQTYIAPE
jgi:hypothetical protein